MIKFSHRALIRLNKPLNRIDRAMTSLNEAIEDAQTRDMHLDKEKNDNPFALYTLDIHRNRESF